MGFSSIDDAVEALRARAPELADDASSAAHWIAGGDDVDDPAAITLAGLQQFVWHGLALKWMKPDEDKPGVVAALAALCDVLDRPLLAQACRSSTTAGVLAAFARSDDAGWKAFGAAMKTSLVNAVDTDRLAWGSMMGLEEARARWIVESALEQGLVDGRVVKGRQGWKVAQRAIVDEVLDRDHPAVPGQSVYTAVITERLGRWVDGRRSAVTLARWRGAVANHLLHPIAVPADVATLFEPLLWFCDELCTEPPPLTQKGMLGQRFVRRTAVERGWWGLRGQPHTETDVWRLHELHQLVRSAGFARHERGHLMPTIAGMETRSNLAGTWARVAEHLAGRDEFDRAAFEACAVQLVAADGPVGRTAMLADAGAALGEAGWQTAGPAGPVAPSDLNVSHGSRAGLSRLELFGAVTEDGDWRERTIALTPSGRALVLAWLRTIAAGPRSGFG